MKFWHPKKLVKETIDSYGDKFEVSFPGHWQFELSKRYKGGGERTALISASDMVREFGNISNALGVFGSEKNESYHIVTEPEPVTRRVEVDESLLR